MAEVIERLRQATPDLTIVCKDGEVMAIRAILAAASQTFDTMLNGPFVEGKSHIINMPDDFVQVVQAAVMYIQYEDLPQTEPEEVMLFLDKYGVKQTALCESFVMHIQDGDNALRVYGKLHRFDEVKSANVRKILLATINKCLISEHVMVCNACNYSEIWRCNICNTCEPCYHRDSRRSHHGSCEKTPNGELIVKKRKFIDPDYELLGRATAEFYGS